ncbi:hypothetical protein MGSAQ_001889 [marine sediment metagenome]|uniref:Uncharacterized protein n=1 Tax=marine sediment metagenome TaxID=412755 RepID=A0A1B6NT17_9ZZZZ
MAICASPAPTSKIRSGRPSASLICALYSTISRRNTANRISPFKPP